jgi:phospholipase C
LLEATSPSTRSSHFISLSPGTIDLRRPPLNSPNIGDRLSAKHIDWAWYSGGWSNANGDVGASGWTNGTGPICSDPQHNANALFPNCPDVNFQFHHQALNYFAQFAPGTAARRPCEGRV